jgi:hypothetical protein
VKNCEERKIEFQRKGIRNQNFVDLNAVENIYRPFSGISSENYRKGLLKNWSSITETFYCPTNIAVVVLSVFFLRIYVLFSVMRRFDQMSE